MTYSYGKTVKKGLWVLLDVGIAGVIANWGNTPYLVGLAPVITMIRNFVKHKLMA